MRVHRQAGRAGGAGAFQRNAVALQCNSRELSLQAPGSCSQPDEPTMSTPGALQPRSKGGGQIIRPGLGPGHLAGCAAAISIPNAQGAWQADSGKQKGIS